MKNTKKMDGGLETTFVDEIANPGHPVPKKE